MSLSRSVYNYKFESDLDSDSDFESDEELMTEIIAIVVPIFCMHLHRKEPYYDQKVIWNEHVSKLNNKGPTKFFRAHRMHYSSFMKLCNYIDPHVRKLSKYSPSTFGVITTEIALHCAIRWLAGASYIELCHHIGVSKTTFYHYTHRVIAAINTCKALDYKLPTEPHEVERAAADFAAISSHGVLQGCIGALDGLLVKTITPSKNEVPHVKAYYSGHYAHYGINMQAICDSSCRFIYLSTNSPGGQNDVLAYQFSKLPEKIEALPLTLSLIHI